MNRDNTDIIKSAGLKITLPRVKILAILTHHAIQHMSAEDIHQALKQQGDDLGLATIYRVLTQFEEAGIVCKHRFEDNHCVFELMPSEHHDHVVCIRCHRVEEFFDPLIEAQQEKIAAEKGFQITGHALQIYGLCEKCQRRPI